MQYKSALHGCIARMYSWASSTFTASARAYQKHVLHGQETRFYIYKWRWRWKCNSVNCFSYSQSPKDVACIGYCVDGNIAGDFNNAKDTFAVCPLRFRVPVSSYEPYTVSTHNNPRLCNIYRQSLDKVTQQVVCSVLYQWLAWCQHHHDHHHHLLSSFTHSR